MLIIPEFDKHELSMNFQGYFTTPNVFSLCFESEAEAKAAKKVLEGLINGNLGAFVISTIVENIEHGTSIKKAIHETLDKENPASV